MPISQTHHIPKFFDFFSISLNFRTLVSGSSLILVSPLALPPNVINTYVQLSPHHSTSFRTTVMDANDSALMPSIWTQWAWNWWHILSWKVPICRSWWVVTLLLTRLIVASRWRAVSWVPRHWRRDGRETGNGTYRYAYTYEVRRFLPCGEIIK